MSTFLAAGALSGIAGLLVFLVIHHFWILPIWFVLPLGLVIAIAGGVAVGWAYAELAPSLPPRPWTSLSLVALIGVILLPSIFLAELRQPMFDVTVPGGLLVVSTRRAALVFILELLMTSTLTGALAGWWLAHTFRAALATATAGLVFALGPGHNIPLLGSTPGAAKGILILLATVLISAFVLVRTQHALGRSSF